jgi:hypothetical protein
VQLQPGEQMELKHVFVAPQPQRKPKAQAPHQPTPGERLDHLIHKYRFW